MILIAISLLPFPGHLAIYTFANAPLPIECFESTYFDASVGHPSSPGAVKNIERVLDIVVLDGRMKKVEMESGE